MKPTTLLPKLQGSVLLLCAGLILNPTAAARVSAQAVTPGRQTEAAQAPLHERMTAFVEAVRGGDPERLAAFFPRRGGWTYVHTLHRSDGDREGRWRFRAQDTREAVSRGPLTASFRINPEGQGIGLFAHQVRHRQGRWRLVGNRRFVPPGGTAASRIFVTWRQEGGVWVVDTLADESFTTRLPEWCCQ